MLKNLMRIVIILLVAGLLGTGFYLLVDKGVIGQTALAGGDRDGAGFERGIPPPEGTPAGNIQFAQRGERGEGGHDGAGDLASGLIGVAGQAGKIGLIVLAIVLLQQGAGLIRRAKVRPMQT